MTKVLGREPAVFWALVAGVLLALLQLFPLPTEVAGAANALVLAAAGVLTAFAVASDKALPALAGLIQAVFALFLSLGTPVPDQIQTGILALLAAVGAFFVRQNVMPPILSSGGTLRDVLADAYDNGYQSGQDDLAVPPDVSTTDAPALPGEHADGPDFGGRLR